MDLNLLRRARPVVAEHLANDLGAFCKQAWGVLHPGSKLSWTTGHDLICDYLMAVYEKKLNRLIINTPPRFAKSSVVTILFPVWVWLQDPTKDFLCCSYEIDLATNHNLDRRRLMSSRWFVDLFGGIVQLATDRSQAQEFSNTAGGTMQAASTSSKAQGRGGHYVLCDDPISSDFVYSESFRTEVNFWFEHQLPQRLNNPSESAIVVVMQRLHQNDPAGFLLAQEDSEWVLLKLALIAEQDETFVFPHSGRVWKRKKGDCLDPKRWSPRTVRERQRNRLVFASQFQQEPVPTEGNLIRADDILYFGGRDPQTGVFDPQVPEQFDRKIISVDCAFKDLRTSNYVAIIVVGVVGARRYLLHVTNAHLDLTGTENEIRNLHSVFGSTAVLVEDKANGSSVIAHLKEEIPGLIAIDPQGGKMSRVVATAPEFQAHDWIIERNGPWAHRVVEQVTMFPNAKNDDITDAITQCAIWLQANRYDETPLVTVFKRIAANLFDPFRVKPKPAVPVAVAGPVVHPPGASKPGPPFGQRPPCPNCGASCVVPLGNVYHCNNCSFEQWIAGAPPEVSVVRRDLFIAGHYSRSRRF